MSDQRDTEHSNTAPAGADEDTGAGTRGYAFFPSPSSSAESSSAPEDSTIGGNERGNEGAHVNDEGHGADGGSQQNDDDQNGGNERQDSGGSSTPQVRTPRGRRSEATSEEDKEKLRKLEEDMKKLEDGSHPDLKQKEQIFNSVKRDAIEKARIHRDYQLQVIENLFDYHKHAAEEIYKNSVEKVRKQIEDDLMRRIRKLRGEKNKHDRATRRNARKGREETQEEKTQLENTLRTAVDGGMLRSDAVLKFSLPKNTIQGDMQLIHSNWKSRVHQFRESCEQDMLFVKVDKDRLFFCDQVLQVEDEVILVSELTAEQFFCKLFAISAADIVVQFPDGGKGRLPLTHLRHGRFTIRKYEPKEFAEPLPEDNIVNDLNNSARVAENLVNNQGRKNNSSSASSTKRRGQKQQTSSSETASSDTPTNSRRQRASSPKEPTKRSKRAQQPPDNQASAAAEEETTTQDEDHVNYNAELISETVNMSTAAEDMESMLQNSEDREMTTGGKRALEEAEEQDAEVTKKARVGESDE